MKTFLLSTAALALATFAARADETVIVTATRLATPASQVASSVDVVASQIEERQLRSLPDILRTMPGLNVVRTGGEGGQTSLFTRGTNANHTKVLLDGIDISDPSTPSGAVDLGRVLAGDVARVEVLRGPSSGLYGSDAIGGVVNIITKTGEGPLTATARIEGGSFDTFNQFGEVSGSDAAFHYRASLQHLHAGATPVTPLSLLPKGQKRNDDYFDGMGAGTKLGYDISSDFDLGLVVRWSGNLSKVTGDAFNPVTFASFPSPTQTRITSQQYDVRGTAHWNTRWLDQMLGLAYGSSQSRSADPNNGPSSSSADRVKLDWQGRVRLGEGQDLVLGAETARDAVHLPLSAGYTTNASYAELQSVWGNGIFSAVSIRYDDNSRSGNKLTWRIAPGVTLGDTGIRLKGSVGSGFKAPSLDQLYHSYPAFFFFANPNLKPETSIGYDAGADWTVFEGVITGITWFHNDITNLITTDPVSFSTNVNLKKARTQGVEMFAAWQAMETLRLRADYTYTDATDGATGLELLRRPRNKVSLAAGWQFRSDAGLDATLLYVGPWIDGSRDFSVPRLKTTGYVTVDLAAHYDLDRHFTLFARAENLFDESYQNPAGFLGVERAFYAGMQAKL
ncbi:MAG: TonB-dependent receptor [Alphaproteobacteria bacterium]|nr:TonB-dependent receptor [Alphaproteobacteria bacterium]